MGSVILALHGVIAATLLMLLLHMHLAQIKGLTVLNTTTFAFGALVWPLVLIAALYVRRVQQNRREEHLQRGLSDGRWRSVLSRVSTDYEIDGDAFKRYEREVNQDIQEAIA